MAARPFLVVAAAACGAFGIASFGACSGDDTKASAPEAGFDVTVHPDSMPEEFNFNVDVPGCPPDVPNGPCSMVNEVCPAPPECEPCFGGYIMRAPECTCQGFWQCDLCGFGCDRCEAGTVYFDPQCQNPQPTDAGFDVRPHPDAGGDAAGDASGEAGLDAASDA